MCSHTIKKETDLYIEGYMDGFRDGKQFKIKCDSIENNILRL
jgi:hypothetical protein